MKKGKQMILEGNDVQHFRFFAEQVKHNVMQWCKLPKAQFIEKQAELVNGLFALEQDFKKLLKKHDLEEQVFTCFYNYITKERRNLLAVRPYFRERADVFVNGLIDLIRKQKYKEVFNHNINYLFVKFAVERLGFKEYPQILEIATKIEEIRAKLVLMNLPLVISRARVFYSRNPRSSLTFMEMIQIGVGGLICAVDKYCGAYGRVWCSVALGRLHGDLIGNNSDTVLHFFPEDRRRIYRINKFFARNSKDDFNEVELLNQINEGVEEKDHATIDIVRELMYAIGLVSVDTRLPLDDEKIPEENITKIAAPDESRPDRMVEQHEGLNKMYSKMNNLTLFQQKILKLKGLEINLC